MLERDTRVDDGDDRALAGAAVPGHRCPDAVDVPLQTRVVGGIPRGREVARALRPGRAPGHRHRDQGEEQRDDCGAGPGQAGAGRAEHASIVVDSVARLGSALGRERGIRACASR